MLLNMVADLVICITLEFILQVLDYISVIVMKG